MQEDDLEEELDLKEVEEIQESLSGCPKGYCPKNLENHFTAK